MNCSWPFSSLAMSLILMMTLGGRGVGLAEAPVALVIHGGAGVGRAQLSAEKEAVARKALELSLREGFKVIEAGGSSLEAVAAAIVVLEDAPSFNAGRGAVLTAEGTTELDASIMDGSDRRAGAVAGVQGVRNPILLARAVMEKSPHVMLSGRGAEAFAREQKLVFEPADYFVIPERIEQLKRAQAKEKERGKTGDASKRVPAEGAELPTEFKVGTVGAVALDKKGHLAAGTSTGGMTNKKHGRIGDSPVIGAGTYAEDGVVAVSCTGHGEYFIRSVVAHDVAARMKYQGLTVDAAARVIIEDDLPKMGGEGGLIALDDEGKVSTPFNTEGMFHGYIRMDGSVWIEIFKK